MGGLAACIGRTVGLAAEAAVGTGSSVMPVIGTRQAGVLTLVRSVMREMRWMTDCGDRAIAAEGVGMRREEDLQRPKENVDGEGRAVVGPLVASLIAAPRHETRDKKKVT